ncbi:MAG: GYF domain-containing protein [Luteolibacter sp.]
MNETPPDAWFYSHEGERIGPVSFSDLRIKAIEAGLNPRLDMVWTHGMPEWKPAGEIEGLFERRAAPEVVEGEVSPDPYRPPEHDSSGEIINPEGEWPGARRRSFLAANLILPFLWGAGFAFATPLLTAQFGQEIMKVMAPASNVVPLLVGLYFSLMRLVNLGMSKWWYLGHFVPILNFWVGYRCFCCPAGYAYHKKLDGVGIFLAILYWLLVVFVLLVIAAVIALFLGALGPDFKQQFDEILQQSIKLQE